MGAPTGVLDVVTARGIETHEWNGNPADRAKAKKAFDEMMATGSYLAVVHDRPGKSHQISSFKEIEQAEMERGVVAAQISTSLVGG